MAVTLASFGTTFDMASMVGYLTDQPRIPGLARDLNLFESEGILTKIAMMDEEDGILSLIPTIPWDAPPVEMRRPSARTRAVVVPHIRAARSIVVGDIAGARQPGTASLKTVEYERNKRLNEMRNSFAATDEFHMVGALNGRVLNADGASVVFDSFQEFGVTRQTIDFDLGNPNSDIQAKCEQLSDMIDDGLGTEYADGIKVFTGKTFHGKLTNHPKVRSSYERQQEGRYLRGDNRRSVIFGDIEFIRYTGKVGSINFVAPNEGSAFPTGVTGVYKRFFAPRQKFSDVGEVGLPEYAWAEMKDDELIRLYMETNPLMFSRKPRSLVKVETSS